MKTQAAKETKESPKKTEEWFVVDAKEQVLGRLATKIASVLRGKDLTRFTPHIDEGRGVVVINAAQVRVTGNKLKDKVYRSNSLYPGGYKEITLERMLKQKPVFVIKHAVRGMLPKSRLGEKIFKRLKVYAGAEHPHSAQQPKPIELK